MLHYVPIFLERFTGRHAAQSLGPRLHVVNAIIQVASDQNIGDRVSIPLKAIFGEGGGGPREPLTKSERIQRKAIDSHCGQKVAKIEQVTAFRYPDLPVVVDRLGNDNLIV